MNEQKYRPPWRSFYLHIVAMVVVFIGAVFFSVKTGFSVKVIWGAFLAAVLYLAADMTYRRFCTMLIVKSDKIALEEGLIGRHSTEISTKNIKTIQVTQTIGQRILNTGDIRVASPGTDEYEITVKNMPDPHAVRDLMQKYERAGDKEEPPSLSI
jgi:uncharacterized membrane protein YdbT with pleckstrin-like domain